MGTSTAKEASLNQLPPELPSLEVLPPGEPASEGAASDELPPGGVNAMRTRELIVEVGSDEDRILYKPKGQTMSDSLAGT